MVGGPAVIEPSMPAIGELSQPVGSPGSLPPGKDMVWVPGGTFAMGAEDFYDEERPVHRVTVDGF